MKIPWGRPGPRCTPWRGEEKPASEAEDGWEQPRSGDCFHRQADCFQREDGHRSSGRPGKLTVGYNRQDDGVLCRDKREPRPGRNSKRSSGGGTLPKQTEALQRRDFKAVANGGQAVKK